LLSGFWLFEWLDLRQVSHFAAGANIISSLWLFLALFGQRRE
jgi:hypothetical protein